MLCLTPFPIFPNSRVNWHTIHLKLCLLAGSSTAMTVEDTILKFVHFITCSEKLKSSILHYNKLKTYSTYYLIIGIITALSSKEYIKIHKYFVRFELKAVIIPIYFCNSKVSEYVFILFTVKITGINVNPFWPKSTSMLQKILKS